MSAEDPGPAPKSDSKNQFQAFPKSGLQVDPGDSGFGVPPPPGADAPVALRELWGRIFGKRLFLIPFVPPGPSLVEQSVRILRREPPGFSMSGSSQDSGNWAGAYATANGGKHLGTMLGLWQVPLDASVPVGRDPADYACSIWIGLDGQRRYFDSSLPQIGTLIQFKDGKRVDFAWVQWWERDSTSNDFLQLDLPVAPGDLIGAFLHVTDPTHVWFVIVNLSIVPVRKAVAFLASAPLNGAEPVVFGATAEWVVERPSHVGLTTMFDLPDFGHCNIAGLALQTAQIGAPLFEGDLRDMAYARLIRMLDQRTDPPRTAIIAMPHRAGPLGVDVSFGGF